MIPYGFFKSGLVPFIPFLIAEAKNIRKNRPIPTPQSNHLILGSEEKRLFIIGESTAAGVGASNSSSTLAGQLFELFGQNYQVTNLGKNGLRAQELFDVFGEDLASLRGHSSGVFLFLGANDCFRLTHPNDYASVLRTTIHYFQKSYSPDWIYLAAIPPVHRFPAFSSMMQYFLKRQRNYLHQKMREIADEIPTIIFEEIDLELSPEFFAGDGVHPSDLGYQKIAQFAFDGIKRWQIKSQKDNL